MITAQVQTRKVGPPVWEQWQDSTDKGQVEEAPGRWERQDHIAGVQTECAPRQAGGQMTLVSLRVFHLSQVYLIQGWVAHHRTQLYSRPPFLEYLVPQAPFQLHIYSSL